MDNTDATQNITIGVFTAELNDSYQAAIWEGISSAAEKRGIGLLSFLGSRLHSPIPQEASSNRIYSLANGENLDGLIIISSAISSYIGHDDVKSLFSQRKNLPQVSLGLEIPGIPSITVDGCGGISEVVEHLIDVHHRKNFVLITGPQEHEESESRKDAVLKTLCRRNLEIPAACQKTGNFEKESGMQAVAELLDAGNDFDALICLNDNMAIGAYEELSARNVKVPDEVSLVGFDGLEESESMPLTLTTVRQPLPELGSAAVDEILGLIRKQKRQNRTLACAPLYGETCGCKHRLISSMEELSDFLASMKPEDREIYRKLLKLAEKRDRNRFIRELSSVIEAQEIDTLSYQRLHALLNLLLVNASAALPEGEARKETGFSMMFVEALTLLARSHMKEQSVRHYAMRERFSIARSVGVSISEAFEVPMILKNLTEGFSQLNINEAYMVLYTAEGPPFSTGTLFPLGSRAETLDSESHIVFPTKSILPPEAGANWKTGHWVLLPLVFQTETLGYILLPGRKPDAAIYDAISKQIATTLTGTRLLDQVRSHEKNLSHEVSKRTRELTRANKQLTQEISRRIRLEEEVIDISNKTMNRIGQDLHDDLCQHLAGISMIATALKKSLDKNPSAAKTAEQINRLIVDSIDRTKGIVRGLVPLGLEEHGLGVATDALVQAVSRSSGIPIDFEEDPDFLIADLNQSVQLYRIIQEALSNSVKHSKCTNIEVKLYSRLSGTGKKQKNVESIIEVSDNGCGIPSGIDSMGMGLKIMKYRAEKANASIEIGPRKTESGTLVTCILRQETS